MTGFPSEVVPIALMRTVSSSASTGLILDIFKTYGPDSFLGRLVSVMFGCTETIFYTMSVYFMTIKVKNSRYTLAGSLLATFVGIAASYLLCVYLFSL
jgi:spore maturation protein B